MKKTLVKFWAVCSKEATYGIVWYPNLMRSPMPFAIFETWHEAQKYAERINDQTAFEEKYSIVEVDLSFDAPKKLK